MKKGLKIAIITSVGVLVGAGAGYGVAALTEQHSNYHETFHEATLERGAYLSHDCNFLGCDHREVAKEYDNFTAQELITRFAKYFLHDESKILKDTCDDLGKDTPCYESAYMTDRAGTTEINNIKTFFTLKSYESKGLELDSDVSIMETESGTRVLYTWFTYESEKTTINLRANVSLYSDMSFVSVYAFIEPTATLDTMRPAGLRLR